MENIVENQNIYQKLSRIRKAVEVMKKDKKGYGYTYTKEESILAKITTYMDKLGLSLLPGIVPGTTVVEPYSYKKTKATAKGDITVNIQFAIWQLTVFAGSVRSR